ncbi:MAG: hypothetical protein ACYDCK_03630 [Thermoplasmatota archaeon]
MNAAPFAFVLPLLMLAGPATGTQAFLGEGTIHLVGSACPPEDFRFSLSADPGAPTWTLTWAPASAGPLDTAPLCGPLATPGGAWSGLAGDPATGLHGRATSTDGCGEAALDLAPLGPATRFSLAVDDNACATDSYALEGSANF